MGLGARSRARTRIASGGKGISNVGVTMGASGWPRGTAANEASREGEQHSGAQRLGRAQDAPWRRRGRRRAGHGRSRGARRSEARRSRGGGTLWQQQQQEGEPGGCGGHDNEGNEGDTGTAHGEVESRGEEEQHGTTVGAACFESRDMQKQTEVAEAFKAP